jgi:hypothetical protein
MDHIQFVTRERPQQEMLEKPRARELFFSAANMKNRTNSVYTEFMESDFELEHNDDSIHDDDGEVYSEFGDLEGIEDGESSPRVSIGSVGAVFCSLGDIILTVA